MKNEVKIAWHSPFIAWITHRNGTDRKNWGKLKFQWIFTPWVNIYWIFNFRRFFSDSVERGPRKTILENSRGTVALKHFSFIFVYIAFYPFSQYKLSNFYVEAPYRKQYITFQCRFPFIQPNRPGSDRIVYYMYIQPIFSRWKEFLWICFWLSQFSSLSLFWRAGNNLINWVFIIFSV